MRAKSLDFHVHWLLDLLEPLLCVETDLKVHVLTEKHFDASFEVSLVLVLSVLCHNDSPFLLGVASTQRLEDSEAWGTFRNLHVFDEFVELFDKGEDVFRVCGEEFAMLEGKLGSISIVWIDRNLERGETILASSVVDGFWFDKFEWAIISQHGWDDS